MVTRGRVLKSAIVTLAVVVIGGAGWLTVAPPLLLRVGDGYAAKIVCSNVFLSGRDPQAVLADDVQAPGHPLLKLLRVSVDRDREVVTSRFMGLFAAAQAVYRDGLGCTVVPDGNVEGVARVVLPAVATEAAGAGEGEWPDGETVPAGDPQVIALLADPSLTGPGMRAVVVVKDGRIVGEAYGGGFGKDTPLLGWSMAKTVNAAILSRVVADGRLSLDDTGLFAEWKDDDRASIRLRDLLGMASGLQFNEDYGDVTDVTRMLFLEADMARFAADKPAVARPGERFGYSSGTSVMLSRIWMTAVGGGDTALAYPRVALFAPLGMRSAILEADAAGTFVGSSYLYATARDWARFGQFLLQDGVWRGERLLPADFVAAMRRPTPVSGGAYTEIQAWHVGPRERPGAALGLPEDIVWLQGHDGQTVAVAFSAGLVVVRLGLTPSRLGYRPQPLLKAIVDRYR